MDPSIIVRADCISQVLGMDHGNSVLGTAWGRQDAQFVQP